MGMLTQSKVIVAGAQESPQSNKKNVLIWLAVAWLLLCIPILIASVPPFIDYPNHLARCFMLAHSGGGYEQFFQADWALIPNLALELIVVPLAHVLPIELAGKIFLMVMFGLTVFSGARLNKALTGDWSILGGACALLVYNRILAYGFLSYMFGIALLPLALAFHIENRDNLKKRFLIDGSFLAILFVSHIMAFGLFVLCAAIYDIMQMRKEKTWNKRFFIDAANLLLPVIIAGAVLVLASPTKNQAAHVHFNFVAKPKLFMQILQTGIGIWDYAFVGFAALVFIYLLAKKQIQVSSVIWPILAAVFVLFAIFPEDIKDSRFMDSRLPIVLVLLLLAAIRPTKEFNAKLATAMFGFLLLFRVGTSAMTYHAWNKSLATVAEDTKQIPAGAIVLTTKEGGYGFTDLDGWTPRLRFQEDSMLDQRPMFIQDIFTFKGQQPLTNTPPYDQIDLPTALGEVNPDVLDNYVYRAYHELNGLGLMDRPVFIYYIKNGGTLSNVSGATIVVQRAHYAILRLND
jgi:hypothetical protein